MVAPSFLFAERRKKLKNHKDCFWTKCLRVSGNEPSESPLPLSLWQRWLLSCAGLQVKKISFASGAILISFFLPATLLAITGTSLLKVLELVRKISQRDLAFEIISFGLGMALFYFYERYIFEPQNIVVCGWIPLAICVVGKLLELLC